MKEQKRRVGFLRSTKTATGTALTASTIINALDEMNPAFSIAFHGGAGLIAKTVDSSLYYTPLRSVADRAFRYAHAGLTDDNITAVDVAEYGAMLLENEPKFNAGKGAVYSAAATHELEASIMNGQTLSCGAVSLIKTVKNPIKLARVVMEKTNHVYMCGDGAENLASLHGLERVDPSYFHTPERLEQLRLAKALTGVFNDHDISKPASESAGDHTTGTIGCVVWYKGHLAAATSTGGRTNKLAGRIGDSSMNGAGNYANDKTCAISCTGQGEEFIRHAAAFDVAARMMYGHESIDSAVHNTVHTVLPPEAGGMIAVDNQGTVVLDFCSEGMVRAKIDANGSGIMGIWKEEVPISLL